MADQPSSTSINPAPHSRGGRHRSRKQQKPSTAEREQKKASRLQALGPGESIKEKQVSDDCKRAKTSMTSWGLACHATRSWRSWCGRNVFLLLANFENPIAVSWDLSWKIQQPVSMLYVLAYDGCVMLTLNFVRRSKSAQLSENELQINIARSLLALQVLVAYKYIFFVNHFLQILSSRQDKRSRQSGLYSVLYNETSYLKKKQKKK